MLNSKNKRCIPTLDDTEVRFSFYEKNYERTVKDVVIKPKGHLTYARGLWIEEDEQEEMTLSNLILNNKFTLEFWVRVSRSTGELLQIPGELGIKLRSGVLEYDIKGSKLTMDDFDMKVW